MNLLIDMLVVTGGCALLFTVLGLISLLLPENLVNKLTSGAENGQQ